MSADNRAEKSLPVDAPELALVKGLQVLDLSEMRLRHTGLKIAPDQNTCTDGLCVLSWRPRKPSGEDVA